MIIPSGVSPSLSFLPLSGCFHPWALVSSFPSLDRFQVHFHHIPFAGFLNKSLLFELVGGLGILLKTL
jgi:hypothetical protein